MKAADQAACKWFGEYGGALAGVGTALAVTPEPISTKIGLGLVLANAAAQTGCNYDPSKGGELGRIDGCSAIVGGYGQLYAKWGGNDWQIQSVLYQGKLCSIDNIDEYPSKFNGQWGYRGQFYSTEDGSGTDCELGNRVHVALDNSEAAVQDAVFKLVPVQGECDKAEQPGIQPPDIADEPYTDPDNGCQLNVKFLGYAEGPAGSLYQITQMDPVLEGRASGGVIGGCNFNSSIVVNNIGGGGNGGSEPPYVFPNPDNPPPSPNPEEPWWVPYVKTALGGVVAGITEEVIESFFNKNYPGLIYRMVSVCEKDAEGEPISEQVEVPIPEMPAPDAQLARLDAIVELLQAHKNFKQPVCPNERPKLEGDWRTISFRSTQSSPYGKSCIRKRFRYRSMSGIGLGELVDHWKDFTWTTGPVIVTHRGHSWGTPQVWAATADEGKRVIQHAAREAGFNANQVGEWGISDSASSRYGVSLPVKVDTTGGYYWITARDGSDGRPIVAQTPNL